MNVTPLGKAVFGEQPAVDNIAGALCMDYLRVVPNGHLSSI